MTRQKAEEYVNKIVEAARRGYHVRFEKLLKESGLTDAKKTDSDSNVDKIWMVLNCQGPGDREGMLDEAKQGLLEELETL